MLEGLYTGKPRVSVDDVGLISRAEASDEELGCIVVSCPCIE